MIYRYYFGGYWTINMQSMKFNNWYLDFILPVSFTYMFYIISNILKNVPWISNILIEVGKDSMIIMFTHLAFKYALEGFMSKWLLVAICILGGIIIAHLLSYNKYTRLFFLGNIILE